MLGLMEVAVAKARLWPAWASVSCTGLLACLLLVHVVEKLLSVWKSRREASYPCCSDATSAQDIKDGEAQTNAAGDVAAFTRFQRQYLVVYALVMFADWLQGTHMYSLYQSYDMNVGALFLSGFLSSVVFGNDVGPLVDEYGRRNACLVYCALEILINVLENVPNMAVLLVGRVLGGISTSLLFSAFESWMVAEHRARGFAEIQLGKTFAIASEANGIVAVVAGLVAQVSADAFGEIGPFRVAVLVTVVAAAFVLAWPENYGSASKSSSKKTESKPSQAPQEQCKVGVKPGESFANAYALGFCYSLFEGAMYVFVFLWYPTLEAVVPDGVLPSGLVFSSFMLCIALGGKVFDLVDSSTIREELLLVLTAAMSAASLLLPTLTSDYKWILSGFLVFEVCVGILTPCCATLRGRHFPTERLSTTLTLFRLPTNILVVLGTGGASYLASDQLFRGCSLVLLVATACAAKLLHASWTPSTPATATQKRKWQ